MDWCGACSQAIMVLPTPQSRKGDSSPKVMEQTNLRKILLLFICLAGTFANAFNGMVVCHFSKLAPKDSFGCKIKRYAVTIMV